MLIFNNDDKNAVHKNNHCIQQVAVQPTASKQSNRKLIKKSKKKKKKLTKTNKDFLKALGFNVKKKDE